MQEENILNVIMYLFKHHMEEGTSIVMAPEKLSTELESAGFSPNSIKMAFAWLENLSLKTQDSMTPPNPDRSRVFQGLEADYIDNQCQAYLQYLTSANILNTVTRELVINQLLHLRDLNIDVSLVKWFTLLVLYNQEDTEKALERMELLVLNDENETVH